MPLNLEKISAFIEDEDENTFGFSVEEELNDHSVKISILGEFNFILSIDENEHYTVSSDEELLEEWVKEVQKYCNQGKKSIEDVLANCTAAYEAIVDEDLDVNEESQEEEDFEDLEDEFEGIDPNILMGNSDYTEKTTEDSSGPQEPNALEIEEAKKQFKLKKSAPQAAINRLMKDFILLTKQDTSKYGFSATPIDNDLFHWEVKLFGFDPKEEIHSDLVEYKKKFGMDYILMDMTFPQEYPFKPPFIRVVKPRLQFHTGHVTIGGSICMELLTPSGWMPSNSIETILIQIWIQLVVGKGRIDFSNTSPYTEQEAHQAFIRVAQFHNWM